MNHNLVSFFFLPFAAIAKVPNSTRSMCCRRSIRPTRTMGTWKSMNQRRPIGCRTMPARTVWINWTPRCWLKSEIAEPHWDMMYFNAIWFVFIINSTQIAQCYCPIVVQRLRRESGWGNRRRTRWATHFTNTIFLIMSFYFNFFIKKRFINIRLTNYNSIIIFLLILFVIIYVVCGRDD